MQAKFLKQIGADEVVYPEHDMAIRLAIKFNANNVFDYIPIGEDYAIYEIPILEEWINKSIIEIDVRKKYNINIVAVKKSEKFLSAQDLRNEREVVVSFSRSTSPEHPATV